MNDTYPNITRKLAGKDVRNIVTCKKYTGFLSWAGYDFGFEGTSAPIQDMVAVDIETFEAAQKVVELLGRGYRGKFTGLSSNIQGWIENYGTDYTCRKLGNLQIVCSKCFRNDDLTSEGNQGDQHLYYCKGCDYHFRMPSGNQIKSFRTLNPLRCMDCGSVENFSNEDSQLKDFVKVTCNDCQFSVIMEETKAPIPPVVILRKQKKRTKKKLGNAPKEGQTQLQEAP